MEIGRRGGWAGGIGRFSWSFGGPLPRTKSGGGRQIRHWVFGVVPSEQGLRGGDGIILIDGLRCVTTDSPLIKTRNAA